MGVLNIFKSLQHIIERKVKNLIVLYVTCRLLQLVTKVPQAMNHTSKNALDSSILQLKATSFFPREEQARVQARLIHSVLPSLTVLPLPTLQTSSAPTVQLNGQQLKSRFDVEQPSTLAVTYTYMVKFINPKRKSDFTTRAWYDTNKKFDTINSLRRKLIAEDQSNAFQLGNLEPPFQAKCRLQNQ